MAGVYGETKVSYDWEHRRKYLDLPFPLDEYARRVDGLRQAMVKSGLDFLLVYSNPSCVGPVRYVANFDSHFGNTIVVVSRDGDLCLVTDSVMHSEPMHTGIWMTWIEDVRAGHHPATVRTAKNVVDFVAEVLNENRLEAARGGLVSARWFTYGFMAGFSELLPDIRLAPADAVFESVRSIKSDLEVAALRRSAEYASIGQDTAFGKATPGMTEKELRAEVVYAMLKAGGDSTIAALTSGPRSGLKHADPSERQIEDGDMLFVDLCAPHQGYMSDVARTGVVGKANDQQRKMLETALEIVRIWLETPFDGGRHARRIAQIDQE